MCESRKNHDANIQIKLILIKMFFANIIFKSCILKITENGY